MDIYISFHNFYDVGISYPASSLDSNWKTPLIIRGLLSQWPLKRVMKDLWMSFLDNVKESYMMKSNRKPYLHLAIEQLSMSLVHRMLQVDARVDSTDRKGRGAFHIAVTTAAIKHAPLYNPERSPWDAESIKREGAMADNIAKFLHGRGSTLAETTIRESRGLRRWGYQNLDREK